VHTVLQLRNLLQSELSIAMSEYLMYEMIYAGIVESNNILRFAKFADLHFEDWQSFGRDPIPSESSFLDCYQLWLRTNYSANDGKAGAHGGIDEGEVHFGPSNNTALLVVTCHKNVRVLHDK
jgi:hypothetical protein